MIIIPTTGLDKDKTLGITNFILIEQGAESVLKAHVVSGAVDVLECRHDFAELALDNLEEGRNIIKVW